MELAGQSVVVVGLARSGIAAARFLAARGARVVATDRKPPDEIAAEALELAGLGVSLALGHRESDGDPQADYTVRGAASGTGGTPVTGAIPTTGIWPGFPAIG